MEKPKIFDYCENLLKEKKIEELFVIDVDEGLIFKIKDKGTNIRIKKIEEIFDKKSGYEILDFWDGVVHYNLDINHVNTIVSKEIKLNDGNYEIHEMAPYGDKLTKIMNKTLELITEPTNITYKPK